jgi:geranylgeranyl reductase family protein
MVMRDGFDNLLIQKSAEKGAYIQEQTRVTSVEEFPDHVLVKTDRENFRSKVIVGADGVTSLVARSLGLRKNARLGVAVEGEMFPNPDSSDLTKYDGSLHLDFNVIPKGYGWIFPKKDHLSVGVFTTLPRMKEIKKYFYLYLADKGLSKDYSCRSLIGHQIPLGGKNEILNTERGLLIGDAAGLADPITGEGIYFALRSGQIAAEVIERSLAGFSCNLDEYTEKIRDEILEDFRYAGYLAKLLYNLSFVSYNLARSLDIVNEGFIKVVSGEYSYREAIKRLPGKMFMV